MSAGVAEVMGVRVSVRRQARRMMCVGVGLLGAASLAAAHAASPAAGEESVVSAFDWLDVAQVQEIERPGERVERMVFSPDGSLMALAAEGDLEVWDVEAGELRHRLAGHVDRELDMNLPITGLAFSPDGATLASTSWSQGGAPEAALILWDLQAGGAQLSLAAEGGCHDVAFTPGGGALWAACGGDVQRYSPVDGSITARLGEQPIEAIALHPDGETLASVAANLGPDPAVSTRVNLWHLGGESPGHIGTLTADATLDSLVFSSDGRHLLSRAHGAQEGAPTQLLVWEWQRGNLAYRHELLGSGAFAIGPDGQTLAGSFRDALLMALDGTPIEHGILIRQQGGADALAFSTSGDRLAWAGKPPTFPAPLVRVWQAEPAPAGGGELPANDYQLIELPEVEATDDPVALARKHYGLREFNPVTVETVTLRMRQSGNILVTLSLEGLKDDSVRAMSYRLLFNPASEGRWQLVEVGRQQQCWRGPTEPDEWTTELCH